MKAISSRKRMTGLRESNIGVFAEVSQTFGRFSATAGVRYEHVKSDYYLTDRLVDGQSKTYNNLFPSANITYTPGDFRFSLSYSNRISRPTYNNLTEQIVKREGYPNVQAFQKVYNKAEELIIEYNEELRAWKNQTEQKKEILDEQGNLRTGFSIIPKGEVYESHIFTKKDEWFKNKAFTKEVKELFTDTINRYVKEESEKLSVFQQGGVYLATKKIGKNNKKYEKDIEFLNKSAILFDMKKGGKPNAY